MFASVVTALLRAVLDETCVDVPAREAGSWTSGISATTFDVELIGDRPVAVRPRRWSDGAL
jgi:hypothetical protein